MKYEAIPQYQRAALELTEHYGLYSDEIRNAVMTIAIRECGGVSLHLLSKKIVNLNVRTRHSVLHMPQGGNPGT